MKLDTITEQNRKEHSYDEFRCSLIHLGPIRLQFNLICFDIYSRD